MTAPLRALCEPTVLGWARRSQGMALAAPARRLGVDEAVVAGWEAGESSPSVNQLRELARLYRRSLAVFFLPEPPTGFDTLRDFRRVAGSSSAAWSPALHEEYRRAHLQRDHLLELLQIEDEQPSARWASAGAGPTPGGDEVFAAGIRRHLVKVAGGQPPAGADRYKHANYWLGAIEDAGVLVLHTRRGEVASSEMRALSLYFDELPVILLNGSEAIRGRLFSAVHELAHLLLHVEGLCDLVTEQRSMNPDGVLEARCNAIAAAVLMPGRAVRDSPVVRELRAGSGTWDYEALARAAAPFGTSAEAFLLRLVNLGLADQAVYDQRRAEFHAAYEDHERASHKRGGDFYRNAVRDLGKGYVRRVASAFERGVIGSYTAATYLDAKVGQVPKLARAADTKAGDADGSR